MDAAIIWIVIGIAGGFGIGLLMRRLWPAPTPKAPTPPANRQQARKLRREVNKR